MRLTLHMPEMKCMMRISHYKESVYIVSPTLQRKYIVRLMLQMNSIMCVLHYKYRV